MSLCINVTKKRSGTSLHPWDQNNCEVSLFQGENMYLYKVGTQSSVLIECAITETCVCQSLVLLFVSLLVLVFLPQNIMLTYHFPLLKFECTNYLTANTYHHKTIQLCIPTIYWLCRQASSQYHHDNIQYTAYHVKTQNQNNNTTAFNNYNQVKQQQYKHIQDDNKVQVYTTLCAANPNILLILNLLLHTFW